MKYLIAAACFLCPALAAGTDDGSWLKEISWSQRAATPIQDIPAGAFVEVSASKEAAAESALKDKAVHGLTRSQMEYYGQEAFRCIEPREPYLVRAEYENGGTGTFMLKRYGSNLLVMHMSMGRPSGIHRSALVACLDFEPSDIFAEVGGAM